MPRAVKTKLMGGRMVSARSKTGDPQCSAAMSAWQNARRGNPASMALDVAMKILGQCRAKAAALRKSGQQRAAGNEARAQVLESRATRGGPITAKDRMAKARELMALRRAQKTNAKVASNTDDERFKMAATIQEARIRDLRGKPSINDARALIARSRAAVAKGVNRASTLGQAAKTRAARGMDQRTRAGAARFAAESRATIGKVVEKVGGMAAPERQRALDNARRSVASLKREVELQNSPVDRMTGYSAKTLAKLRSAKLIVKRLAAIKP